MSTKADIESGSIPDKDYLYGKFQKGEDWISKFGRKLAYKSQDLADDDVNINQHKSGMGWKELAVIALALLGAGGLYQMNQSNNATPAAPTAPTAPQAGPVDSAYSVIFYDKDGNKIDVPHISHKGSGK